jgi:hypothetical protein
MNIEQEIQAKGLTAPRVTPADVEANIASEHYFTAKALMGMMASRNPNSPRFHPDDDAAYVYAVADAMLKAREA